MTKCIICKLPLTNPKSIERGIGPICWGKIRMEQVLRLTELFDPGAQNNGEDDYPTLHDYINQITIWDCPNCGTDLGQDMGMRIHHHKYESGWELHGWHEKQWIYLSCPGCRINFALWKLGV